MVINPAVGCNYFPPGPRLAYLSAAERHHLLAIGSPELMFATRCYASAAYADVRCPSVCLSRSWTLSKWIILKFFLITGSHTILGFPHQTSWQYSDGDLVTGRASNAGGVGKIAILDEQLAIDRWLVECEQQLRQCDRAVYHTDGDSSVNICLSQPAAWTTTTKRRKENIIQWYAVERQVINSRRLRSTFCTI